jgi:antirestriction protein ArdC
MNSEEIKKLTDRSIETLMASMSQGKSESLVRYLQMVARFHRYSLHNVLLIDLQNPNASYVAGFRTWNKLGRFVRKGEKGILILAPLTKRIAQEDACQREVETMRVVGFRSAYVFDVSQTDGVPLPSLGTVSGDPGIHLARLMEFAASEGITVEHSGDVAPARGISLGGKIVLMPDMAPAEEFATLAHEVGHELLHRGERRATTTKTIRETEAEAVAYTVCSAVELQTSTASQDYIALYNGDSAVLLESLTFIQEAATKIIRALRLEGAQLDGPHQT